MHGKNKFLLSIAIAVVLLSITPSIGDNFSPESRSANIAITATYPVTGGVTPAIVEQTVVPAETGTSAQKTAGFEIFLAITTLSAVYMLGRNRK